MLFEMGLIELVSNLFKKIHFPTELLSPNFFVLGSKFFRMLDNLLQKSGEWLIDIVDNMSSGNLTGRNGNSHCR